MSKGSGPTFEMINRGVVYPNLDGLKFHIGDTGGKMQDEEPDDTPETILKWMETAVYEDEPVGMYYIVGWALSNFGMQGIEAIEYVDRCIAVLLQSGAVPCQPGYPEYREYIEDWSYGTEPDAIRKAVVAEWVANGAGILEHWTGPFFGAPGTSVVPESQATRFPTAR